MLAANLPHDHATPCLQAASLLKKPAAAVKNTSLLKKPAAAVMKPMVMKAMKAAGGAKEHILSLAFVTCICDLFANER
jgi:hypothetical protein